MRAGSDARDRERERETSFIVRHIDHLELAEKCIKIQYRYSSQSVRSLRTCARACVRARACERQGESRHINISLHGTNEDGHGGWGR